MLVPYLPQAPAPHAPSAGVGPETAAAPKVAPKVAPLPFTAGVLVQLHGLGPTDNKATLKVGCPITFVDRSDTRLLSALPPKRLSQSRYSCVFQALFASAQPAYIDHELGAADAILRFVEPAHAARALSIVPPSMTAAKIEGAWMSG